MGGSVEIPIWVLVVVALFAAVTALDRILVPSARWYLRRRMERVVARVNERLSVPIQPFKLARRHDMIQRLLYSPAVIEAVAEHAAETGVPENVVFEEARTYAREIVPSFSVALYFGFAIRAARWLSTSLYRVRLGYFDEAALSQVDPDATIVFVMNHRSNMDYVLVTYLAADRSALSYAVGEWARVWPLSRLIRTLGGYFIRRKSRNTLYRRVLARYVQMATENGVTQAVFPEGGLSLDGHVAPPKLGLLSYILAGFEPGQGRDVVFVPIGLNYDRVFEDRVLIEAHERGERKFGFRPLRFLRFCLRQLVRRLTKRFYRFGYAAVSFGAPLSLTAFLAEQPEDPGAALGAALMQRVEAVVPVLPVPLVAALVLQIPGISKDALRQTFAAEVDRLRAQGVHVHLPREDSAYAVEVGLRALRLRYLIEDRDGGVFPTAGEEPVLRFYANSIAQFHEK